MDNDVSLEVLVPYGVSTFLFEIMIRANILNYKFSSPTGYLHFYSCSEKVGLIRIERFSSPTGYLHFYSILLFRFLLEYLNVLVPYGVSTFLFAEGLCLAALNYDCSRPLRGIYISIPN